MEDKIVKWAPDEFEPEQTSIWDFPDRGRWATHDGAWRGNTSPYVVRNLIEKYTNVNDLIVDPFMGAGTAEIEAKLMNRRCIGIECNETAIDIAKCKTSFEHEGADGKVKILKGDAREMSMIKDERASLVFTHPPYANMVKYSTDNPHDMSLLPVDEFLDEMYKVASESYRILKPGGYCALLIADIREHGMIVPLSSYLLMVYLNSGFSLRDTVIKRQHNCRSTGGWTGIGADKNFMLISHETLHIFIK